jgi:ankyrin repeat protein
VLLEHGLDDAEELALQLGWAVTYGMAGTDVPSDQEWETALHAAANRGDAAMAQLLLGLGAEPARSTPASGRPPHSGRSTPGTPSWRTCSAAVLAEVLVVLQ